MITVSEALYALGIDGGWKIKDGKVTKWWADKPQPSQSEIDTKIAELRAADPMRLLRQERNHRLVETDWTQNRDVTLSTTLIGKHTDRHCVIYHQLLNHN